MRKGVKKWSFSVAKMGALAPFLKKIERTT
jgi:hypothetical protein